jgi:hypothetical protein
LALKQLAQGRLVEQRRLLLRTQWRQTLRLVALVLVVLVLMRLKLQLNRTQPCS